MVQNHRGAIYRHTPRDVPQSHGWEDRQQVQERSPRVKLLQELVYSQLLQATGKAGPHVPQDFLEWHIQGEGEKRNPQVS